MPLTGTLRTWNDDRGFGFIAPTHGGRELFVHISAFARDGSRPTVGETLTYELGRGKDGQPQAVRVYRQALGKPSEYPRPRPRSHQPARRRRSAAVRVLGLAAFIGIGAFVYGKYASDTRRTAVPDAAISAPDTQPVASPGQAAFRCDGRKYCSQMTSCAEATYFLKHCPDVQMDGDHDGIPCEQQWCR